MKNSTHYCKYLVLICLLLFFSVKGFAQHIFASSDNTSSANLLCLGCTVTNPANAVDGNLETYSTLNVTLGVAASTYEDLIFSGSVTANTPVTVKLGTGNTLLSLTALGEVNIQPYNGTTAIGSPIAASSLVSVLSNNNQYELTIAPTQTYDRIRVTLNGGLLSVLGNLYVYDAFYNGGAAVACNSAFDELNGISSGLLNLGLAVGGVENPQNAFDGNLSTAATLNAGVGLVGAYAQETVIFDAPSVLGDSIRVTLGVPTSLISAGVLSNISLTSFNGNTSNNDTKNLSSNLLNVSLLGINNNLQTVVVTYAPTSLFDRVQVTLGGGIASVLSTLNLYEVQKTIPSPIIKVNGVVTNAAQICTGSTVALVATTVANTTFAWYTTATGGTPVFTGTNFTTPALSANTTYYVAANRNGCTDQSARTAVAITVNPLPSAPVITNGAVVQACSGNTVALSISNPITGYTYNWYSAATGGTSVFTGTAFTTPAITAAITYYAEAVSSSGCISPTRTAVAISVNPLPAAPVVSNGTTAQVCSGSSVTLSISSPVTGNTYNWYSAATGGTPLSTGTSFTTGNLTANTVYYAEAVNATGCISSTRTVVNINVNALPIAPTVTDQGGSSTPAVCSGSSATLTATSITPNVTFNWYAASTGGTPLFTGATFTTPALITSTTYYVGDVSTTGCNSSTLTAVTVTVNQTPAAPVITNNNVTVCPGSTATFTAQGITGVTINWYSAAIGGTPLFTGNTYTTGAINQTTSFYAEAASGGTCLSATRTQVTATLSTLPAAPTLTAASETICDGSTAIFSIASPVVGVTYNWYAAATGGTPLFTGTSFTTPALSANTTYYAEAENSTGCPSSTRVVATATIQPAPADPALSATTLAVTYNQTANISVTNAQTGVTYNWYTTPTGTTPVFTGTSFTTPALTAVTTYYVGAINITGCPSVNRAQVTITPIPDITITPPTETINAGSTVTLTASSTDPAAVFNWYTTATGGTSVFTGATFTSPAIFANTTYYADATDPSSGAISATRASSVITVNAVASNPVPCDAAINQTNTTSGLLCLLCSISNAGGSVDNNSNTFSQLSVPVGLTGGYAQQTLQFASAGIAGDSVIVELGIPGSLASVGVLSQISLATYNGATYNNDRFNLNGSTINVTLLSGTSTFRVAFAATSAFDRVEVRLNSGLAGVLNTLNIYYAAQEVAAPVISTANVTACQGTQTTLTATPSSDATIKWYTTATGGTPVFTGSVFNTPALSTNITYYAEASRTADGCTQAVRTPVNVTVTPIPATAVVSSPTVSVCSGQPATFTANNVTGVTFNWYTAATGGTPVFTGNPFTTPSLSNTTSYYVEADGSGSCGSATRTQVTANVTATPNVPVISQTPVQTCTGSSAVLTATSAQSGVTFNWYTAATGGTPVFTGPQFTTPALVANTSYFVDASSGTCTSSTRAEADVVVNPTPATATFTVIPASAQVTSGNTVTINAASTTVGVTFNWYTTLTGGTPIFTGSSFTSPALTANTTYYIESELTATGCINPTRTAVNITVNPIFSTSCDFASSQTNVVNGLCIGCAINNPNNAVDADTTSSSQLNILAGLIGGNVSQTLIFGDTGSAGDTVIVKIGSPASLLAAGVFSQIQIASFNGATSNGDMINLTNSLLSVKLLSGNTIAEIKFVPKGTFDRVTITLNSAITSLITSLNIYYASKQVSVPSLTATTVNICSGNTATFAVNNPAADVTYKWYASATGGAALFTGTTFTTGALASTTTYYVESSRTANGCANPNRVAASANVTQSPVNPVLAQSNVIICSGNAATLTVTNVGTATVNWYDALTNGNLLFTGANFTVSPTNNASYYAEFSNGTCVSPARTLATVTVNPLPIQPVLVSNNVQVCSGSTAALQVSSPQAGVTYNWYDAATGGTLVFTGTNITTPAITAAITYYAEADNTTTGCANTGGRVAANITLNSTVIAPTLSAITTQICNGGSVTLSVDNPATGFVYNWYAAATGGTPIFTGSTFTATNLIANASYFVDATSGAGCTSATRTETDVTVLPIPTAPQVQTPAGGLSTCSGISTTISIINPQSGTVYNWYDAASGGTLLFTGNAFTTPAITSNTTYYVDASTAGNCNPSARTAAAVTINQLPADPTFASANVTVCLGSPATFSITAPQTGVTYNWYDSATETNLVFTGTTYTTGPLTTAANYYVSASNTAGCTTANPVQVQASIQALPSAPVIANGTPVQVCTGSTLTLNISNPQTGFTYNWYSAATGGTPVFTGSSFTTAALTANVSYFAEAENSTGCISSTRTEVDININSLPVQPTVTDQANSSTPVVCSGSPAILTATSTTPNAIFNWYTVATGGTPIFTGATFTTPAITTTANYYVEAVSTGNCNPSTRDAVTVTVNPVPTDPTFASANVTVCSGNTATFTISAPQTGVTYNWYDSPAKTNLVFTGTTYVTGPMTTNTSFYVSVSNVSGCSSPDLAQVQVIIQALPLAPVIANGNNIQSCSGSSVTLSISNQQTGFTYNWYTAATGGVPIFTGTSFTTAALTANASYFAEAVNNTGCTSSARTEVDINVNTLPSAPTITDQAGSSTPSVCSGSPATLTATSTTANVTFNWYTAATGGSPIFTGATFITPSINTASTYYVESESSGGCSSASRTGVTITVNPLPADPTVTAANITVCLGSPATLNVSAPQGGVAYTWYDSSAKTNLLFTGTTYITGPLTTATSFYVSATNASGCTSPDLAQVQVSIGTTTTPLAQVDTSGLTICKNSVAVIAITNPNPNITYNFYTVATSGSPVYTGTNFNTPALAASTTYYVEAVGTGYCNPSSRLAVNVNIIPQPSAPVLASATVSVCTGNQATLTIASPQAGITYNWYDSASKTNLLYTGSSFVTNVISADVTFYVEASNGSCTGSVLTPAQVNAVSMPNAPALISATIPDCEGGQATLAIAKPQPGFTYNWYSTASGGSTLYTGTNFLTPALTANASFYAEATNSTGCTSTTRTTANVNVLSAPAAPVVSQQDTAICPGLSIALTASSDTGTSINWYASATGGTSLFTGSSFTTPVLTTNTMYYAESESNIGGCSSITRTPININIIQPLAAPIITVSDTTVSSVTFTWASVVGATGYQVSLNNGISFNSPSSGDAGLTEVVNDLQPAQTVSIIVRATGTTACALGLNSLVVTALTTNPFGDGIYVPNAFTPNGDGNNDLFLVYGNTIKGLTLSVYDQWGELQYRTTNKFGGWDGTYKGKSQPVGVYVYYLEATMNDGKVVKKKGTITLLR